MPITPTNPFKGRQTRADILGTLWEEFDILDVEETISDAAQGACPIGFLFYRNRGKTATGAGRAQEAIEKNLAGLAFIDHN